MNVSIGVFDRDYNAFIGQHTITVSDLSEAEAYCKESRWSGESYVILHYWSQA